MVTWRYYGQHEKSEALLNFKNLVNSKIYDMDYKNFDDFFNNRLPLHSAIKYYLHSCNGVMYGKQKEQTYKAMLRYFYMYNVFTKEFLDVLFNLHEYITENSYLYSMNDANHKYCNDYSKNIDLHTEIIMGIFRSFGKEIDTFNMYEIMFLHESFYEYMPSKSFVKVIDEESLLFYRDFFKEETSFLIEMAYCTSEYKCDENSDVSVEDYNMTYLDEWAECLRGQLTDADNIQYFLIKDMKTDDYCTSILFDGIQNSCISETNDIRYDKGRKLLNLSIGYGCFTESSSCDYLITLVCMLLLDYGWCNLIKLK